MNFNLKIDRLLRAVDELSAILTEMKREQAGLSRQVFAGWIDDGLREIKRYRSDWSAPYPRGMRIASPFPLGNSFP